MDREKLSTAFAKAKLMGLEEGEIMLIEHLLGIQGSFYQGLYDLFYKADFDNKNRLGNAFPCLAYLDRYMDEPDWFEEELRVKARKAGFPL